MLPRFDISNYQSLLAATPSPAPKAAPKASSSGGGSDRPGSGASSSLLQRCELASSSPEEKSSEDKDVEDTSKKTSSKGRGRGKGRGNKQNQKEEGEEVQEEVMKKPAKKEKKRRAGDEYEGLFDDYLHDDENDPDDLGQDEGEEPKKKKPSTRKTSSKKKEKTEKAPKKGKSGGRKHDDGSKELEDDKDTVFMIGYNKTKPAPLTSDRLQRAMSFASVSEAPVKAIGEIDNRGNEQDKDNHGNQDKSEVPEELHAGDKVVQRALDSYVVLATAESQGRMEVEHAFKVSEKLADGTLLGSSLADAKGPCDSESLGTTLVLGDEISSQELPEEVQEEGPSDKNLEEPPVANKEKTKEYAKVSKFVIDPTPIKKFRPNAIAGFVDGYISDGFDDVEEVPTTKAPATAKCAAKAKAKSLAKAKAMAQCATKASAKAKCSAKAKAKSAAKAKCSPKAKAKSGAKAKAKSTPKAKASVKAKAKSAMKKSRVKNGSDAGQKENKSCPRNLIYSRVYRQEMAKGKTNEEARAGARLELLRLGYSCKTRRVVG